MAQESKAQDEIIADVFKNFQRFSSWPLESSGVIDDIRRGKFEYEVICISKAAILKLLIKAIID